MQHKRLSAQFGLRWMMAALLALTCAIGALACRYAYQQRRSALLQELDLRLQRVATEYENLVDDFWSLYISVFSHRDDMFFFYNYYSEPSAEPLGSEDRVELRRILTEMALRDGAVQWIAVYAPLRAVNYLYFTAIELPADFAYQNELDIKTDRMEIYPVKRVTTSENSYFGLAIAGGVPSFGNLEGSVLASYNINNLVQLCQIESQFDSLQFDIPGSRSGCGGRGRSPAQAGCSTARTGSAGTSAPPRSSPTGRGSAIPSLGTSWSGRPARPPARSCFRCCSSGSSRRCCSISSWSSASSARSR